MGAGDRLPTLLAPLPADWMRSGISSLNSARARLKPVVDELARLFATTFIFCSWTIMPVAAVYRERIMVEVLESW